MNEQKPRVQLPKQGPVLKDVALDFIFQDLPNTQEKPKKKEEEKKK